MYFYVLSVVLVWIAIKLVGFAWDYVQTCRRVAPIPRLYPQHWFWGFLHKKKNLSDKQFGSQIRNPTDFLVVCTDYVRQAKPRWFSAWNMFFYPVIVPVNPGTMREVLTATNVPKNKALDGSYRMLEGWLDDGRILVSNGKKWERSCLLLTPIFHFDILKGDGLLISNGKKWERSRHLLTPAFHFDILKGYVQDFNDVADIFVSMLEELSKIGDSVDVFPPVSRATLDSMLRCTVSYEDTNVQNTDRVTLESMLRCTVSYKDYDEQNTKDHHPYVVAVNQISTLFARRWLNPLYYPDWIYYRTAQGREFKELCDFVHTFSSDIIKRRRQELGKEPTVTHKRHLDFLDTLLTAKDSDGKGLSDLEIRNEVDTFVFEGHDTTASGISWTLNALAKYPTMQQKVRQEVETILNGRTNLEPEDLSKLPYTTCFIKESMRLYSPVPLTERKLSEPLKMNDITLKPGQEFQPDRFLPANMKAKDPYAFIPFSAGQRNCIGQHFAMNEMKVKIAKTVMRFDISLDPYRPAVPKLEVVLRSQDGIYLYFKERQSP